MAHQEDDHSDVDDMIYEEDDYPLDEENISDSNDEWPIDSDTTEADDDERSIDDSQANRNNATATSSSPPISYTWLILIGGAVFLAMLPVWFQSPNGFPLIKESFQGDSNNNNNDPNCKSALKANERLFTKRELAKYTKKPKILLGFLGVVYDVTGGQYYHPDGSYHFFAGIDGTRGFLTGEFTPKELIDDISDLDSSYLSGIDTWLNLYKEKYERVGLLVGSYYDSKGCETDKLRHVEKMIEQAKASVKDDNADLERYPPCNSEWNATEKRGRVWCTKLSGGINRSWIGHPRLFYQLNTKNWRCACIEADEDINDWCDQSNDDSKVKSPGVKYAKGQQKEDTPNCLFKHYTDCDPKSTECPFQD